MVIEPVKNSKKHNNSSTLSELNPSRPAMEMTYSMTETDRSLTSDLRQASGTLGSIIGFEGSFMLIVFDKLNGTNYREWVQAVKLAINSRGKVGLVTGAMKMLDETNIQALQQLCTENALVSLW